MPQAWLLLISSFPQIFLFPKSFSVQQPAAPFFQLFKPSIWGSSLIPPFPTMYPTLSAYPFNYQNTYRIQPCLINLATTCSPWNTTTAFQPFPCFRSCPSHFFQHENQIMSLLCQNPYDGSLFHSKSQQMAYKALLDPSHLPLFCFTHSDPALLVSLQ